MNPVRFLLLLLGLLLFSSCASGPSGPLLRPGMTKAEVRGALGKPLRVHKEAGAEDWFYRTATERRVLETEDNSKLPGETVHERDLRHSFDGIVTSASSTTETVYREQAVHFSTEGRLLAKELFHLQPVECA